MKKKLVLVMGVAISLSLCACLSAQAERKGTAKDDKIEKVNDEVAMVTVKDLREYYGDSLKDIPDEYLESFLESFPIAEDELAGASWDVVIKDTFGEDVALGCDINEMRTEKNNDESMDVFLQNINRVVVTVTKPYNGELVKDIYSVLDFEKGKVFQFDDSAISYEYVKADNVYEIGSSEEEYKAILTDIMENIDEEKLNSFDGYEKWEILLEDTNKTIKTFSYSGDDRDSNKSVYKFLTEYMKLNLE